MFYIRTYQSSTEPHDNVSLILKCTKVLLVILSFLSFTAHVALPDHIASAMENWGLITYREANFLYDNNTAGVDEKQRVAITISHELSHMV